MFEGNASCWKLPCCLHTEENQARIMLRIRLQSETSDLRDESKGCHKILINILSTWVMTSKCLGHNNTYSQICTIILVPICQYTILFANTHYYYSMYLPIRIFICKYALFL